MTNESPTGSPHLGGIQARVTKPSSWFIRSHAMASTIKEKEVSLRKQKGTSTNILTNTTTEPTHKI